MLLLLQKGLVFFAQTSIHDSPIYTLHFTFDYCASFRFETRSEGILLHTFCDLPTVVSDVCVLSYVSKTLFTHLKMSEILSEIVRNLYKFRPKFLSENLMPECKTSENFGN